MKNKTTIITKIKDGISENQIIFAGLILFIFSPLVATAAPSNFKGVVKIMVDVLFTVLPVIVLLSFIYFFWGLIRYIKTEKGKEEAKAVMINGIIAFFVMTSVWALTFILTRTFVEPGGVNYPSDTRVIKDFR